MADQTDWQAEYHDACRTLGRLAHLLDQIAVALKG